MTKVDRSTAFVDELYGTFYRCPHCNSTNFEESKYCNNCGNKLEYVTEKELFDSLQPFDLWVEVSSDFVREKQYSGEISAVIQWTYEVDENDFIMYRCYKFGQRFMVEKYNLIESNLPTNYYIV